MANFVEALIAHKERLARLEAEGQEPPDLDRLWELLSPSLEQALDERDERVVAYVNSTTARLERKPR